jgi:putative ubiquitin-RnfH superfamily antitoxin RatB of RatAB toxin-antitoxin module
MGDADRDASAGAAAPTLLRVSVACSPRAGVAFEIEVVLPAPATALGAVRASGVFDRCPGLATGDPSIGIWGRVVAADTLLRDGDRVELYRPLKRDPKEARRRRAGQGGRRRRDPSLPSG